MIVISLPRDRWGSWELWWWRREWGRLLQTVLLKPAKTCKITHFNQACKVLNPDRWKCDFWVYLQLWYCIQHTWFWQLWTFAECCSGSFQGNLIKCQGILWKLYCAKIFTGVKLPRIFYCHLLYSILIRRKKFIFFIKFFDNA